MEWVSALIDSTSSESFINKKVAQRLQHAINPVIQLLINYKWSNHMIRIHDWFLCSLYFTKIITFLWVKQFIESEFITFFVLIW